MGYVPALGLAAPKPLSLAWEGLCYLPGFPPGPCSFQGKGTGTGPKAGYVPELKEPGTESRTQAMGKRDKCLKTMGHSLLLPQRPGADRVVCFFKAPMHEMHKDKPSMSIVQSTGKIPDQP